ncbi:hypothetical protein BCD67_03720 [Oscillatoriales cyanobacterium USR001]|nr:hypothetical protein BCD67_03720 [Oscillatoriales cyanobacterium USR001]
MTFIPAPEIKSINYPSRTRERADRAIRCAPFQLKLFQTMRETSVFLGAIASHSGLQSGYTRSPLTESTAENSLLWLIQVGVLRREVDGQGITDSFRLTPLGRQLIAKFEQQGDSLPPPSWRDRLYNTLSRWLRLPF